MFFFRKVLMQRVFKIGLLGSGYMGRTHSFSVLSIPYHYLGCEFGGRYVSVCSSTEESAQRAACQLGIEKSTANEDDIINDPDIDVVDICTPNIYHFETAKKAILAGKHVLCEKPLAINAQQALELDRLAKDAFEKNGQVCGMVFNNRHLSAVRRARELVEKGNLGRILSFDFKYLHNSCVDPKRSPGWKQNADICGAGTLFDLGAHVVDLCRHLCGEFASVYAKEQIAFPTHRLADGTEWHTNADEAAYITATMKCGAVGTITAGKISVGENDGLTFSVYGTRGAIKFDLMEPNWLHFYDADAAGGDHGGMCGFTRIECVGRYAAPGGQFPSSKAPSGWLRGHIGSMYSYLNAIYKGVPASPSFEDGALAQIVLDAAHRSHVMGNEIIID